MLAFQSHIASWLFEQLPTAIAPGAGALSKEMLAKEIPLTLAGVSGAVGAVVVVFILFALQSLDRESLEELTSPDRLPVKREIAAIHLLLSTSSVAMIALLLTPVFLLYNLAAQALAPADAVAIGLGSFAFSVTTLIVGLFTYFVVSTIRSRRLDEVSRGLEAPERTTDAIVAVDG